MRFELELVARDRVRAPFCSGWVVLGGGHQPGEPGLVDVRGSLLCYGHLAMGKCRASVSLK